MATNLDLIVYTLGYTSAHYYTYRAVVTENYQNIAANTTNVTIGFYMSDTGGGAGFEDYSTSNYGIAVDGEMKVSMQRAENTSVNNGGSSFVKIGSWTGNITHAADGSKSISVGLCWKSGNGYNTQEYLPKQNSGYDSYPAGTPTIWDMGSVALTTIPRATTPSIGTVTLGSAITISLPRASTSFTHNLTYQFGNVSGTIATGAGDSATWNVPPLSLAEQIPDNASGVGTITCQTISGGSVIGSVTINFSANVPDSVVPSISSIQATEYVSGLAAQFGGFVQGKSQLAVSISASGAYGSTIRSYSTKIEGVSYSGRSFTSNVVKGSGTIAITTTVVDSRQRTFTNTANVTVYPYFAPKINAFSAWRVNTSGAAADDGERLGIRCAYEVASVNGRNARGYSLEYRVSTDAAFSEIESGTAATSYDETKTYTSAPVVSGNYSFVVRLTVSDYFTSAFVDVAIPTAFVLMNWKGDGTGMGIGKVSEVSNALDMGVPIVMNSNRVTGLPTPTDDTDAVPLGYIDPKYAPSGYGLGSEKCNTDYTHANDCLAAGWYRVAFDVPVEDAYWLIRVDCYGGGYVKQTAYAIAGASSIDSMCVCRRYMEKGTWSDWDWENPPMDVGVEYRTTERYQGKPVYAQTVSIGNLPNNGVKTFLHGISSIDKMVSACGTSGGSSFPMVSTNGRAIELSVGNTTIYVTTTYDCSSAVGYVNLKYTKTTD